MEDGLFNETPVLILTVMKNITHLKNLNELFDSNRIKTIKPNVLIIDDEADQASLNTKAKSKLENEVSAIYNSIRNLRSKITKNTYLQYTATPQGPLLISILDILSPNFVKILTPGSKYTGGKYFFEKNKNSIYPNLKIIPEDQIYSKDNIIVRIPESLENALIYFYLTVLIGIKNNEHPSTHNRTMMIHPSQLTEIHNVYKRWVDLTTKRWVQEFNESDLDPDKQKLVDRFFRIYENEIQPYNHQLSKDDIMQKIHLVIKKTPAPCKEIKKQ